MARQPFLDQGTRPHRARCSVGSVAYASCPPEPPATARCAPGCHACAICDSPQEQLRVLVPYVRRGLARGQQCVIAVSERTCRALLHGLAALDIDVDQAVERGALDLVAADGGLADIAAVKDPVGSMLSFWRATAALPPGSGFTGLRAVIEPEADVVARAGIEQWIEHEHHLTRMLAQRGGRLLCAYQRRAHSPELIREAIRAHAVASHAGVSRRNPYYRPPADLVAQPAEREVDWMLARLRAPDERQTELVRMSGLMCLAQLTASIMHEVRQPLTAVVANAGAALRWLACAPPQLDQARDALARIVRDGNRASAVISRVRGFTSGGDGLRQSVSVNALIRDVAALAQMQLNASRIVLRLRLHSNLPPVLGDASQLQQVLVNLVLNGVDAINARGCTPRTLAITSSLQARAEVCVAVQDSGVGLDPRTRKRMFEPFYTTKPRGMGIGLAVCRSIIEAHGGRLWAAEGGRQGATILFTLPAAAVEPG